MTYIATNQHYCMEEVCDAMACTSALDDCRSLAEMPRSRNCRSSSMNYQFGTACITEYIQATFILIRLTVASGKVVTGILRLVK